MKKVIVIGAGVMGLAAAYELLKKGYSVEIFEAEDKIGGMSAHFDFNGMSIEKFYHFICKPDSPMFDYLSELGILHRLKWTSTRMGYYYNGKHYRWGDPVSLMTFSGLGFISKIRYGLFAFTSTKREKWDKLDSKNAVEWIKFWTGNKAYDVLWKRLFELKFFSYSSNMSAAWIWTRIKRVGLSRKNILQEELGCIDGGSAVLLNALEKEILSMGGRIHLNRPVEKIIARDSVIRTVVSGKTRHRADIVISTIPLPFIPGILDGVDEELILQYRSVKNIPVVCAIIKLNCSITSNFWLNVCDDRIDIPGVIEYTNLNPLDGKTKIAYIPYYMPDSHPDFLKPDNYFIERSREYIKMINPSISDDQIKEIRILRYRYAQPICGPEYLKNLPRINPGIQGLFIADTSYYYPEDRSISESLRLGKIIAQKAWEENNAG